MTNKGMLDCGDYPDDDLEDLLDEFKLGQRKFTCRICEEDFTRQWNGKSKRPCLCSDECRRKGKQIAKKTAD